jgi:hypothetical protein
MRRREFIKLIAGSAVTWPLVARAQQATIPVVGFLNAASAPCGDCDRRYAAELVGLAPRNVRVEYRWGANDPDLDPEASSFVRAFAQGLAELGWTIGKRRIPSPLRGKEIAPPRGSRLRTLWRVSAGALWF